MLAKERNELKIKRKENSQLVEKIKENDSSEIMNKISRLAIEFKTNESLLEDYQKDLLTARKTITELESRANSLKSDFYPHKSSSMHKI